MSNSVHVPEFPVIRGDNWLNNMTEAIVDVSNLIFLPTNFRFGWLTVKIPTQLPPYKVSVLVE